MKKQLLLLFAAAFSLGVVSANTITVNSAADVAGDDGQCTLREAMTSANTNTASGGMSGECAAGGAGTDTIVFNIAGGGVKTITPASALPAISAPLLIDGYTQPGASANTNSLSAGINAVLRIELDQAQGQGGLVINAGGAGTTIRGLVLNRGIDEIQINADNVTISGNFIGTNSAGTIALPSVSGGFGIRQNAGNNNTIGGSAAADINLLAGDTQGAIIVTNGNGTQILGNYIGTDVTGTLALNISTANPIGIDIVFDGVFFLTANTVISDNLISGNGEGGVQAGGGGLIQGNLVGTQRDGVSPLGNLNFGGITINAGNGWAVGGAASGLGNTIAFNTGAGITVQNNTSGHSILRNSIYSNSQLGINLSSSGTPLANDPCDTDRVPGNLGQNFPVITSASVAGGNVSISGTLNSAASTAFRVEFFANTACDPLGNGEGQTFLGAATVTTDASCNASFGPLRFPFPSGQTTFSATATDRQNNTSEFSACFSNASAEPSVQFGAATLSVNEGSNNVVLTVTRTGDSSGTSTVHYATANGSATSGSDYTATSGDLTFGPGITSRTFSVPIIDDSISEGNETFTATLSAPGGGASLGMPSKATVTIIDNDGSSTPTPSPTPTTVQLLNISGRSFGQLDDQVSISGFIVSGASKKVTVRGIGPTLGTGDSAISNPLPDPMIELHDGTGAIIQTNDNWRDTQEAAIQATGLAPASDLESTLIATLAPGPYTAILRGVNNSTGVGLVEVYDLEPMTGELANVSVRAATLTDDNVLINGLILSGAIPKNFVFRALGPELADRGISGELLDPMITVYDGNGAILGNNDNWQDSPDAAAITADGLAPTDPRESALLLLLPPGNYTAIVEGADRTTGIALAEVYKLD